MAKLYSILKTGYSKWETENTNGLNDIFTRREYASLVEGIRNTLERECRFIASDYAIEVTRRQYGANTKDWKYDNDTFIICLSKGIYGRVRFTGPDIISLEGLYPEITAGDTIVVTGTGGVNDGSFTVAAVTYSEARTNVQVTGSITTMITAPTAYVEDTTNPFYAVEQGNLEESNNLLYPEYCYNLRISPARNAMRHLFTMLQAYRDYETARIRFSGGDGNFAADIKMTGDDCVLEASLLPEGADLQAGFAADTSDVYPFYWPELVEFSKYPMTFSQYLAIKANPYGLVEYDCGGAVESGWIEDLKYNPVFGEADFTLIPKIT